jgi:transposase
VEENPLLPRPFGMQIEQIRASENEVNVTVVATHPTSNCPLCRQPSSSIHSRYRRIVRDAPCAGRRIRLILCVRKFFCRNLLCERKIFTERLPDLVRPWAKMTIRYCEQLTSIGLATSGKAGTRLAARLGIKTTRQSVLRHVMALPDDPAGSILYLGIDDFAFKRGYCFGTILVNLENRRVVDLLPNRETETAAAWMKSQVDLMAVSRDRGGEYASAAAQGAPQAIQSADRFHLLKNLEEALEGLLAHHLATANQKSTSVVGREQAPVLQPKRANRISPKVQRLQQNRREERLAHYEQVMTLHRLGMSQQAIAKQVGISDSTIQRWLAAGSFVFSQAA